MSKIQHPIMSGQPAYEYRKPARFRTRDNGLEFSPITLALHWIVALLVLSILAMKGVALIEPTWNPARAVNLCGTMLFPLSLYRFWARVTSWHPLPLGTPNPVEVIISRCVAVALALAMILLPIAAWLAKSSAGVAIDLPGGIVVPAIVHVHAGAAHSFDVLYRIGGVAFLGGLALHVFGACKNQFVLKNDSLKRMLGKHVEL